MLKNEHEMKMERRVVDLIKHVNDDPLSFNALMDTWNRIFEIELNDTGDRFAQVEGAAIKSLMSFEDVAPEAEIGRRVGKMLDQFPHAAFLVNQNGIISAQNAAAFSTFGLGFHEKLNQLPFALAGDEPLDAVVCDSLDPLRNHHDAILRQAFSKNDESKVTLAITPSRIDRSGQGEALVFVINGAWTTNAGRLIQREFDLSNTERELLLSFLSGATTQEIAGARERSHATIRTQMYSLMGKMGARTQTELLRNALSVSQFIDQVSGLADALRFPHRKRVDAMRPHGRSVEVTLAGDLSGSPVVFLHSMTNYTNPPLVEKALFDHGICAICICRPGYSDTSPPLEGDDYFETFVGDLSSVLDQLGHDHAAVFAINTSPPLSYKLALAMPHRITHIIQSAGTVPLPYILNSTAASSWAKGVISAGMDHPALMEFMIRTAVKAWRALGARRFMTLQCKQNQEELAAVLKPDSLREFDIALEISTGNGTKRAAKEMYLGFTDYSDDVRTNTAPTLILHGELDGVFAISSIRDFADDFPEKVKLVSFKDGYGPILCTHTNEVIGAIRDFIHSRPKNSTN